MAPIQVVRHPEQFGSAIKEDVVHPEEAGKSIEKAGAAAFKADPAKAAGSAVFEIGGLLVPGFGEGNAALKTVDVAHKAAITHQGIVGGVPVLASTAGPTAVKGSG